MNTEIESTLTRSSTDTALAEAGRRFKDVSIRSRDWDTIMRREYDDKPAPKEIVGDSPFRGEKVMLSKAWAPK